MIALQSLKRCSVSATGRALVRDIQRSPDGSRSVDEFRWHGVSAALPWRPQRPLCAGRPEGLHSDRGPVPERLQLRTHSEKICICLVLTFFRRNITINMYMYLSIRIH